MVAVKGIYHGGDTVKLDASLLQLHEPYEVIITFLNPVQNTNTTGEVLEAEQKRQAAFQRFMQYQGTLSADFDYKKELNEYREGRYGRIN